MKLDKIYELTDHEYNNFFNSKKKDISLILQILSSNIIILVNHNIKLLGEMFKYNVPLHNKLNEFSKKLTLVKHLDDSLIVNELYPVMLNNKRIIVEIYNKYKNIDFEKTDVRTILLFIVDILSNDDLYKLYLNLDLKSLVVLNDSTKSIINVLKQLIYVNDRSKYTEFLNVLYDIDDDSIDIIDNVSEHVIKKYSDKILNANANEIVPLLIDFCKDINIYDNTISNYINIYEIIFTNIKEFNTIFKNIYNILVLSERYFKAKLYK